MPAVEPGPTLEEWRGLYDRARSFQEAAPWKWLSDQHLVAVEEPVSKEVGYCSIMGAAGIQQGLVAYRGTRGLHSFSLISNGQLDEDETLLTQDCVIFYMGDREMVFPRDREVHQALGLRFRGRGAWPIFRTYRPGFLPVPPTGQEARLLSACLEQTCALLSDLTSGVPLPDFPTGTAFLARRRRKDGDWETTTLPFPPPPPSPSVGSDELRLERLRRELPRAGQTWQAAVQAVAPIAEDPAAPYWAWLLLCVDEESGFILGGEVVGPEGTVQEQLLNAVSQARVLPEQLQVTSGLLQSQLTPLAERLGINVRRVKRMRQLERASKSLKLRFGRA